MLTFSILSVPEQLYAVFTTVLHFEIIFWFSFWLFVCLFFNLNQKSSEYSDNWDIKIYFFNPA